MSSTPIADHALLSDRHSSALVSTAGSVEWLSFPRFDSPSVFGRLLGEQAGYWQIQPAGTARVTRRYVERTLVLETTFTHGVRDARVDRSAGDGPRQWWASPGP